MNLYHTGLSGLYMEIESLGDPLTGISDRVDFERGRPILSDLCENDTEKGGRPNYDLVLMVKMLRNKRNKAAYIWVAENGDEKIITYDRIYGRVNNFAKALLDLGIKKGDRIIIYLPMFLTRQRLRTEKHRWKSGIPQRFSLVFYFKNLFLPFINFEYSETELTPF